ncbi:MAG: hypothetical protein HYU66_11805 [Armatimonadetes bacterium]|nr:hypothetical protein [Armatimonadota bacterium]
MTAVMLAACALIGFVSPHSTTLLPLALTAATAGGDLPLEVPAGWKIELQDRATVLTPGDVAEGKLYAVMVTMVQGTAGTLDEILEDGGKMVAEIGTFKAAMEPKQSRSDGGWDYKFVLGTITAGGRSLLGQLMAIKHGDEGGVVVVLSDGVETMGQYADAFADMVRGMGVAEPAPAPPGAVDLRYTVPAGWAAQEVNGFPLLVKAKNEEWVKYRFSLLIFPSEALTGTVREQFAGYWKSFVIPNYTSTIAPLPLMVRLKSGYACAFDADSEVKDANGAQVTVAIYMLAHGGRVVPVMGTYSGPNWTFDKAAEAEIGQFLDSAQIPGASAEKVVLFAPADLAGEWSESSSEFANRVTRDGAYAGDATTSTGAYFQLGADGSYSRTLMALTRGRNIREKDSGTWSVEDDELVLSKGGRYSLLGYGAEPKVGRFLVLGKYSNTKARLKLTDPRGILQAQWLRAK